MKRKQLAPRLALVKKEIVSLQDASLVNGGGGGALTGAGIVRWVLSQRDR